MCTVVAISRLRADAPLVVAANRDEFLDRAAGPPERLGRGDGGAIFGGRDLSRGGTWMGVTSGGFFVGLTNQRTWRRADPTRRSRGDVVMAMLRAGATEPAEALLRGLRPSDYNPFNLLFGDAGALRVAYVRDEPGSVEVEALPPGVHVLANDRLGSPHFPKAARLRDAVRAAVALESPLSLPRLDERLTARLADHALPPYGEVPPPPAGALFPRLVAWRLQAVCVHTPTYGTVSSTILRLREGGVDAYLHARGSPCQVAMEDYGGLLATEEA